MVIACKGADTAGFAFRAEVERNPDTCNRQQLLGPAVVRQARLPIREGGYGLASCADIAGAAYVGCHALVFDKVIAASSDGGLTLLFDRLPSRPMAAVGADELKKCSKFAKPRPLDEITGDFWTSPPLGQDPAGRRVSTLLTYAGAV